MHKWATQQERGAPSQATPSTEACSDCFYEPCLDADCYAASAGGSSYGVSLAALGPLPLLRGSGCPGQEFAPTWDGCYNFVEADELLKGVRSAGSDPWHTSQSDDSLPWNGKEAISLQGDAYACSSSIRRFALEEDTKSMAWTSEAALSFSKAEVCSQGLVGAIDQSAPPAGDGRNVVDAVAGLELARVGSFSTRDAWPEEQAECSCFVDSAAWVPKPKHWAPQSQLQMLFTNLHSPPPAPKVRFFMHSITTFRMRLPSASLPHDIGNTFLHFLEDGVQAIVLKVRPVKFWISADIFREGGLVRVKARSYAGEPGAYLLELQRRTGCPLAFQQVYAEAISFYSRCGFDVFSHAESPAECDVFRMLENTSTAELWGLYDFQSPPLCGDQLAPCLLLDGNGHWYPEAPEVESRGDEQAKTASPCCSLCTDGPASSLLGVRLEERLTDLSPKSPSSSPLPARADSDEGEPPTSVASLLDRAASTSAPSVQAESMYVAANLAREYPEVFLRGIDVLCKTLTLLLAGKFAEEPEAQFAFAHLMQQLASHAEVSHCFAREGIWRLLSGDFLHRASAPAIRKQVVHSLVLAKKHLDHSDAEGSIQFDSILPAS